MLACALSTAPGTRHAVIPFVDARDHLAGGDVLVVGNRDGGEVTGHLGRDGELTRGDERVVSRFKVRGVVPIEICRRVLGDVEVLLNVASRIG
jgi:hypothetical protein